MFIGFGPDVHILHQGQLTIHQPSNFERELRSPCCARDETNVQQQRQNIWKLCWYKCPLCQYEQHRNVACFVRSRLRIQQAAVETGISSGNVNHDPKVRCPASGFQRNRLRHAPLAFQMISTLLGDDVHVWSKINCHSRTRQNASATRRTSISHPCVRSETNLQRGTSAGASARSFLLEELWYNIHTFPTTKHNMRTIFF